MVDFGSGGKDQKWIRVRMYLIRRQKVDVRRKQGNANSSYSTTFSSLGFQDRPLPFTDRGVGLVQAEYSDVRVKLDVSGTSIPLQPSKGGPSS
jgi:hypothetical protein